MTPGPIATQARELPRAIVVATRRTACEVLESALWASGRVVPAGGFTRSSEAIAGTPHEVGVAVIQPGASIGLDAVCGLALRRPPLRSVVLAEEGSVDEIARWLRCGAVEVLSPEASLEDLVEAIGRVAVPRGDQPSLARSSCPSHAGGGLGRLTQRELQVAELLDRGMSNNEIADRLVIQLPTVKNHVHSLLEKLEIKRRGQVGAALRHSEPGEGPRVQRSGSGTAR